MPFMKRIFHWLDENLEEFLLVIGLIAMTLIMGVQVFCRYVLGMSLSWSEELTRYIFIWCGFLSVSYCSKKCLSIKIEQFVAIFPRRGKAIFKIVNHTFELIFFIYMIPFDIFIGFFKHTFFLFYSKLFCSDHLLCFLIKEMHLMWHKGKFHLISHLAYFIF